MGLYFSYTFLASEMELFIQIRVIQMRAEQWINVGFGAHSAEQDGCSVFTSTASAFAISEKSQT